MIYKRPSDLSLKADVPVCCNILICDMFDEGVPLSAALLHSMACMQYASMIGW